MSNVEMASIEVFKFLQENQEKFLKWDYVRFLSFICMAMEEWCRENCQDVVEISSEITSTVATVNAELGRYGNEPAN